MHRIDTPTAQIDKFGPGKNGFTNGDPATGRRATDLNSDMWDAVQEEMANAIEGNGIKLDKSKHNQLYLAIQKAITDPGFLKKANNLADVKDKAEGRKNLGVYSKEENDNTFLPNAGGKVSGEIQSTSADNYRIVAGDYGTFWRNDGNNVYLMLTKAKDPYGTWNDLRPMTVDVKTGFVTLGHGGKIGGSLSVGNELHVAGNGNFNGTGFITKNGLNSYSNESGNHHQTNGLRLQGAGNLFAEIYHHEQIGEYHELAIHVANGGGDGWFGFRPDGGFYLNGPGPSLNVGAAKMASDGNILGSCWGNKWLWDAVIEQVSGRVDWGTFNREVGARPTTDYVNVIFVKRIRLGPEEHIGANGVKEYHGPKVLAGFFNNDWDSTTEVMYWRPIQYLIGNNWIDVGFD